MAILNGADNNSLIGTTLTQPPFVFLNLVSGNGGNGLHIKDSNNTTVQANCFGLADDNMTALANHLDGVLIEGSSANTQFGGVIPLGNIMPATAEMALKSPTLPMGLSVSILSAACRRSRSPRSATPSTASLSPRPAAIMSCAPM